MRLELETVLEAASVLEADLVAACCWWARLSEEMESGVLMGSTPGPACSALYLMLVYSRPTSWDFCSAASLDKQWSQSPQSQTTFPLTFG